MQPDLSVQALPRGVIRLSKTESANAERIFELTIPISGTDVAPARWAVNGSSVPPWLSLPILEGSIGVMEPSGNLSLKASTAGLAEDLATPYEGLLHLDVTSQRNETFELRVSLYVTAPTLAHTSIWGRPTDKRRCQPDATHDNEPIQAVVGEAYEVPFTACDFEGLAVDHEDKGLFKAVLIDRSSSKLHDSSPTVSVSNQLPGLYVVVVLAPHLGEFGLRLSFTAADDTTEQVGVERTMQAICPRASGQTALSDGVTCGCVAGEYFDVDVRACKPCPVGEYCAEGATLGARCPVGLTTNGPGARRPDECGCPTGTYDPDATADGAIGCEPCNSHMECTRTGLTLATVPLLPSRWRLSNRTASAYECTSSACLGGNWKVTSDGYCAQGHEGPRCEWCLDPGQYYDVTTATCKDCGNMAGYALRQMAILLAIAVALGLLRVVVLRAPRLLVRTCRKLAQTATSMQQFGLQAKFKCCLTFYQVWAVRQSVYGFELPGSLSGVMAFFDALSFDIGTFIFPSWTCLGGLSARLVFSGLWPLALMAVAALCLLALEAARKGGSLHRALLRSLEAAIFISFCVLPSVTRSLFLAFKCESFLYDDQLRESRRYLSASLNIECYSTDHEPIYTTAWLFIVLWPVVLPLLYGALLFRCRSAILEHQPSTLSRAVSFLWFDYDDRCFWFEMVELVQKLVLTNFLIFVNFEESGSNKLLRLFLGLLISLVGLTFQLIAQPFRKRTDNAIASVVRLMLVLFFVLGIMVKLCDTEGPNTVHNLLDAKIEASKFCFELVGVATTEAVAWLILCAGLLVVLVPLGMFVQKLAFSQAIPILRDARTMEPPVLLLGPGKHYHLFLSHVWSTGQDQCAVIKRQLQLLLPGVVIFLDVDGASPPYMFLSFATSPLANLCPRQIRFNPCGGRFAGHRRLGGLRACDGRDALLPVKALLHLPQLPSRGQGDDQREAAAGPRARAAGGEGRRAAGDDADGVPRGDALVRLRRARAYRVAPHLALPEPHAQAHRDRDATARPQGDVSRASGRGQHRRARAAAAPRALVQRWQSRRSGDGSRAEGRVGGWWRRDPGGGEAA
jgi:hypothetical protein